MIADLTVAFLTHPHRNAVCAAVFVGTLLATGIVVALDVLERRGQS